MASTKAGSRGVYQADVEEKLSYKVFDADNHIYPPADAAVRHLEKKYVERVFPTGKTHRTQVDVVGDEHKAKTLGEHPVGEHGGVNPLELPEMKGDIPVPGAMLNKLNAAKGLDKEGQEKLVGTFREMEPAFENRDERVKLMDDQGVQAAVIHAGGGGAGAPLTEVTIPRATQPPGRGTDTSNRIGASTIRAASSRRPTSRSSM